MFETGVDELSWDNMEEMNSPDFAWPTVEETVAFRERVRAQLEALVEALPEPATCGQVGPDSAWWALFMGFDHERIHLETSSVLIRQLPVHAVCRPERWIYAPSRAREPAAAPANELVTVPAATVVLGKPEDFPSFGWDNEYGERVRGGMGWGGAGLLGKPEPCHPIPHPTPPPRPARPRPRVPRLQVPGHQR